MRCWPIGLIIPVIALASCTAGPNDQLTSQGQALPVPAGYVARDYVGGRLIVQESLITSAFEAQCSSNPAWTCDNLGQYEWSVSFSASATTLYFFHKQLEQAGAHVSAFACVSRGPSSEWECTGG